MFFSSRIRETALNLWMKNYMEKKRTIYLIIGILFIIAACCFIAGAVNHILNTGEGVLSSVLLALGCASLAFAFLNTWRKK